MFTKVYDISESDFKTETYHVPNTNTQVTRVHCDKPVVTPIGLLSETPYEMMLVFFANDGTTLYAIIPQGE